MLRRIDREKRGQALIIIALVMVVLVGFLALAIDGGNAYAQHRIMQNVVDATTLAGVQELVRGGCEGGCEGGCPAVEETIREYAERNGVHTPDITTSYICEEEELVGVTVTTTITFPTFFAGFVGVPSMSASASAVARLVEGSIFGGSIFDWALFAGNLDDDQAIIINGEGLEVEGNIHSNGGILINGEDNTIDGGTESVRRFYLNGEDNTLGAPFEITESGGYVINGEDNTYSDPTYTANTEEMPPYNLSDYGPGKPDGVLEADWHYHSGDWSFNGEDETLTGLYYVVEGDITINGEDLGGQATFVATGDIKLNGEDFDFTTYDGKIVLFSNAGSIEINGEDIALSGVVYAPEGLTKLNGENVSINGSVIADIIEIYGEDMKVISYDPSYFTKRSIRLME